MITFLLTRIILACPMSLMASPKCKRISASVHNLVAREIHYFLG